MYKHKVQIIKPDHINHSKDLILKIDLIIINNGLDLTIIVITSHRITNLVFSKIDQLMLHLMQINQDLITTISNARHFSVMIRHHGLSSVHQTPPTINFGIVLSRQIKIDQIQILIFQKNRLKGLIEISITIDLINNIALMLPKISPARLLQSKWNRQNQKLSS